MSQPVVLFCDICGKGINLIKGEIVNQCKNCKKRVCQSCFKDTYCKNCYRDIENEKKRIEFPKKICLNCVKDTLNKGQSAYMESYLKPINDIYCDRCRKPLYQINSKEEFYSFQCKKCHNIIHTGRIEKESKWVCTHCGKKNDFGDWEDCIRIRFNVVDWKDILRSKLNF